MSERRTATFSKVLNMTFWQVAYLILDNDLSPSINQTTKISKFQKTTNFYFNNDVFTWAFLQFLFVFIIF